MACISRFHLLSLPYLSKDYFANIKNHAHLNSITPSSGNLLTVTQLSDSRTLPKEISDPCTLTFNTIIKSFSHHKSPSNVLFFFNEMLKSGVPPDNYTLPPVLRACGDLCAIGVGRGIQGIALKLNMEGDVYVCAALIDLYGKIGDLDHAVRVFEHMPVRDVVVWSSLIGLYEKCGCFEHALRVFSSMRLCAAEEPNEASLVSSLSSCAHLGALGLGQQIHAYVVKLGYKVPHGKKVRTCVGELGSGVENQGCSIILGNVLIDMYSKCGCVDEARLVFCKMPKRDVFTWSGLIMGLAIHGLSEEALSVFSKMKKARVAPNHITFVGVLNACGHAGLVEEGHRHFDSMSREHRLNPRMEHYGCMVDLLSRAGHLEEAELLIETMPMKPDSVIWGALLGACRIHGNVEMGARVGRRALELDPSHGGRYTLLSNIYAAAQQWDDVDMVRLMMRDRAIEKRPGCSAIEVNGTVHQFSVGDRRHLWAQEIYLMLEVVNKTMRIEQLGR